MDKQQATDHILARLEGGYQADEITEELSRLLKVPASKLQPFVNQVAASHSEVAPISVAAPENLAETPEPEEISPEEAQPPLPAETIQPRRKPQMQDIAQMLAALPSNTMRRPTGNDRPVTHGLPTGPGAGPEVLQPYHQTPPGLRTIELLAKTSNNPLYRTILDRFQRRP